MSAAEQTADRQQDAVARGVRADRPGRVIGVDVGALQDPERPDLRELLRRQLDVELHRGLHQPVRRIRRSAGGAARLAVLRRRAGLIALCSPSPTASRNLPGYVFVASTIGLAAVLYLAYASYFVLNVVCLLCVGTYVAVIGLFLISGSATRYPMTSLPMRMIDDLQLLVRTPRALTAAVVFLAAAAAAIVVFPEQAVTAAPATTEHGSRRSRRRRCRRRSCSSSSSTWRSSRA